MVSNEHGEMGYRLQWGRAPISAEMDRIIRLRTDSDALQWGPRSDERGNAMPVYQNEFEILASMGPRSDERGNVVRPSTHTHCPALQWGRAPMSAEIINRPQGSTITFVLQWGRAPMSAEIPGVPALHSGHGVASMGPRSDERGNLIGCGRNRYKTLSFNGAALR